MASPAVTTPEENTTLPTPAPSASAPASMPAARDPVPAADAPPPTETPAAKPVAATVEHPLEARDLETFFDGLIPPQLLIQDVAGATVCVVKDGEVLLSKGYGYADFKAGKPVSAEDTLFRPGSISKTFVATAIMQLVEAGQLNLDRDVNDYLDFRLPARKFPQFLTLRQLLTHTAGFEESVGELFLAPDDKLVSLRDYVTRNTPPQLFSPGTVTAYSNYGMALAGYVVEHVSGQPFADYVTTHVFGPLGMTHSTFAQPPPEPLAGNLSLGYHKAGDEAAIPFERIPAVPAGGLSTTAGDMGRFMRMLLNGGTLDGKQILAPESVKAIFDRQHVAHTSLNAMGLVFYGSTEGERFITGHAGDTVAFHSDMFLLPASRTGVFLSLNSQSSDRIRAIVRRAFLDRYFPPPPPPAPGPVTDTVKTDAHAAAGRYQSSRRIESSFLKVGDLLNQTSILARPDGSLTTSAKDLRGHLVQWDPVAGQPLVYREHEGPRLIAFQRDADKKINTLYVDFPGLELQRVPWYENAFLVAPLIIGSLVVILLTALLWPIAGLVRRRYARPAVEGWTARTFFVLTRVVCVIDALAIIGWLALLGAFNDDLALLNGHHLLWQLPSLYILGRVGAAGGILALVGALLFLHPKFPVRRVVRAQQWLIVAACAIFAAFAWHWHFLA